MTTNTGAAAHACEETVIGPIRCDQPSYMLVKHRGRDEGPYWMCLEHGTHNVRNRNAEDVTPAEVKMQRPKIDVIGYKIREDLMDEVYTLLSRLERMS